VTFYNIMKLLPQLEALLFIFGEPVGVKKLANILRCSEREIEESLPVLEQELARDERGVMLLRHKQTLQLVTKSEFSKLLETITKEEFSEDLTPAALETLSIIGYTGPVTRAHIEYVRGVNSSFIMRTLLLRGLIERTVDPKRANAYLYTISPAALRHLGLGKQNDLPEYQKYSTLIETLHQEIAAKEKQDQEQQAQAFAQQVHMLENAVKQKLTHEALQRYTNVKMAHPQKAMQVLVLAAQLIEQQKLTQIDDKKLKYLLLQLQDKKDIKIIRK